MASRGEQRWRLLTDDGVAAGRGLAADEVLARGVATGAVPPTLRLYTYRPHCALVGRFQDVTNEIDVAYCEQHGIEINRRPTGGGAIIMGPDQLGVALAVRGRGGPHGRARELMVKFSAGLVHALGSLGIAATFRGKNDLEVGGRKIAGLGIYRDPSGGLLFHASLLVGLDVELMSRVLKTPFERVTERELATVAGRTATVRKILSSEISVEEVRRLVAVGFAGTLEVELAPGSLSTAERTAIDELAREKYASERWIEQRTDVPDGSGVARLETEGGLLDVRVATAGRTIKAAWVRGDFFAAEAAVADLEGRLRWHSSDPDAIARTIDAWACAVAVDTIVPAKLTEAVVAAAADARGVAEPYGCFVAPGGQA